MADPDTPTPHEGGAIALAALEFVSDHRLLKACKGESAWKSDGPSCPTPHWSPREAVPVSMTMDQEIRIRLTLDVPQGDAPGNVTVSGVAPPDLTFTREGVALKPGSQAIELASAQKLAKRVQKLELAVRWSLPGAPLRIAPDQTTNVVYVTMGRPADDKQGEWDEDGVTLKRMDRAVSWVAPLETLDPHAIVGALMAKFPYYTLTPSPKVPKQFRHPTYFNDEGGAWPMSDYVPESGECQAIVRLIRGILRQVGVPGQTRVIAVWGDPNVENGRKALSGDLEMQPSAGLDTTTVVQGRQWRAALVDGPVEEGKSYPPSHTRGSRGEISPGLNRYEACLEFTHGGQTLYYGGGAGVFREKQEVLAAFWGLVWVSAAPNDGFKVEKIVAKYASEGGVA